MFKKGDYVRCVTHPDLSDPEHDSVYIGGVYRVKNAVDHGCVISSDGIMWYNIRFEAVDIKTLTKTERLIYDIEMD